MSSYILVTCLYTQPSDNDNRVIMTWVGPDEIERTYTVNQRTLNGYTTAEELKAALDRWTLLSFGYVLDDVFFHLNRDGTWAVATGAPLPVWPEDRIAHGGTP